MDDTPNENFDLNNAFYLHLMMFYRKNKKMIRTHYKKLSKAFLDYNDPERPGSFLRDPQFEALEIYIFLKEFLDNAPVYKLFDQWYADEGAFKGRNFDSNDRQGDMLWSLSEKQYKGIFKQMKAANNGRIYPNYIFALTMGTGKTILMATCIFYEFLLSNKFPKDKRFIHNALVFAPDKTVLQSLRELESFDHSKVIPPDYLNAIAIKFHYLEDTGVSLNTLDGSRFNIVVSNSQKIILRRKNAEQTATDKLFSASKEIYKKDEIGADMAALLNLGEDETIEAPQEEGELVTNQRFEKLRRLENLGIFVDEAHHAFGAKLAKDMGIKADAAQNSLRKTIDELALSLQKRGSQLVACHNYTGTPYVGKDVLPEVVYAYGLKEAIDKSYLKKVVLNGYSNTKEPEFLDLAITDFLKQTEGKRPEGMLPKMAIFGTTVQEVQEEIRPAVEAVLAKHGIPTDRILVNVGDSKVTTNDDIREFNKLDTKSSEKQFILLVNKGREGWNCRSLFSVALHRSPKSKVFVLQATMRCLRSIGNTQETGHVYLTNDNMTLLDKELQANFRISTDEMQSVGKDKIRVEIRPIQPIEKVKLKRIKRSFKMKDKVLKEGEKLGLDNIDLSGYRIMHQRMEGLNHDEFTNRPKGITKEISYIKEPMAFTEYNLTAEISRYLNKPCLQVNKIIKSTQEGFDGILKLVNQFNEVLYDHIIPRLFKLLYDIETEQEEQEYEVALVKEPPVFPGYYEMNAAKDMIVGINLPIKSKASPTFKGIKDGAADYLVNGKQKNPAVQEYLNNSFHLDNYCFDSIPERDFFWHVLQSKTVDKIWFTGMLTHGQSEFYIQYVDPDTHRVRSYYPDFLIRKKSGALVMVEVKGENMIDHPTVKAKQEYAEMIAKASEIDMSYVVIPSRKAAAGNFDRSILN
ncbi:type III restriction-modification protein [Marinomonas sp. SBI22]|uniref:DEAD/DEAH box helicase family protein n=1 Tax=unclassified Marinomonas TaxID=196814 RepID=UPI0007AEE878|nr:MULTISPECIES: DEAD/DEAH box helicase family protein [unclassified Marinomonas]KZM40813.1 type III restriction-modification protein [Marinomonas sp. SBI8L]KZM46002.1 type III restriction-modification protein [Marinomonas sp. SBI22]